MPPVTQWTPGAGFRMPAIDPTRALAASQRAFSSISDSIRQGREAESLAATRAEELDLKRRAQDFDEGAMERALQEEETLFQRGRDRNIAKSERMEDVLGNVGGSRYDEVLASVNMGELLKNEQAYQDMNPEQKAAWEQRFSEGLANRKDMTSDVETLRSDMRRRAAATGDYNTPDELEAAVSTGMQTVMKQKLMDKDIIAGMIPGTSDSSGPRAKFYEKMALKAMDREGKGINESNFINSQEYKQDWFENKNIEAERWSLFGFEPIDIGQPKVYQKKVNKLIGDAAQRGFSQGAVLGTLDEFVYDEHSPSNMDLGNLNTTPDPETGISQADDFWTKVADKQRQISGGGNDLAAILMGAGGAGGQAAGLKTSDLLSGLDYQNASQEKINSYALAEFRKRHGSAQVKKGEVNPRTGMTNPETAEEAIVQEALVNPGANPELADAIAAGPPEPEAGLAEILGGASRSVVDSGAGAVGAVDEFIDDSKRVAGSAGAELYNMLQGDSPVLDNFLRGYRGR